MEKEKVLYYIGRISPKAREFVDEFYEGVTVLFEVKEQDNEGVFLKVDSEDMCIYYASFKNDSLLEILIRIKEELKMNPYTSPEVCFNVYGGNERIIELVQNNSFVLDMEGYILTYKGKTPPMDCVCEIMVRDYKPEYLCSFISLFESAYEKLNKDNGWDTNGYSKNPIGFGNELLELNKHKQIKSFWINDVLIGCYIIEGSYLRDIVVLPRFQGYGYGKMFLNHFLRYMQEEKGIPKVFLRVTKSNIGARKLYERNGFIVISNFAEHTYRKK